MSANYWQGYEEIFGRKERPMGRRDDDPIFAEPQTTEPESEKKPKGKKEICPHCATKNLIQETLWLKKCLKCGWSD